MDKFKILFGISKNEIKKKCIITPLLTKNMLKYFNIETVRKGQLYSVGMHNDFTLIITGMGAGFVGDAVLYLKDTPCEKVILFGSCGLTQIKNGLAIGGLVTPIKCYSNESFTEMLLSGIENSKQYFPDKICMENLLQSVTEININKVVCSTVSSLKLEEDYLDLMINKGIDVLDMECSSFFSASKYVGLQSVALFYITDIVKTAPFYNLNDIEKNAINLSIEKAINYLIGLPF